MSDMNGCCRPLYTSTVWRTVAEGTVGSKYCKGPQTLTEFQNVAAYLLENLICTDLLVQTGTIVSHLFSATTFQGKSYIWLPNSAMNNHDCHLWDLSTRNDWGVTINEEVWVYFERTTCFIKKASRESIMWQQWMWIVLFVLTALQIT